LFAVFWRGVRRRRAERGKRAKAEGGSRSEEEKEKEEKGYVTGEEETEKVCERGRCYR
jgi:hypothetical protein